MSQIVYVELNNMGKIPYVGQRMSISELKKHLGTLKFDDFKPQFVTVHHTASPNLTQRPEGFTEQHLLNLKYYYESEMNWSGAPHFFVDDKGIILFQKLDKRGVHAVTFNKNSWGIEMLGHYDTKVDFDSPRAKEIFDTTHELVAVLCDFLNVRPNTLKFHRDDPKTKKTCPGKLVDKNKFIEAVDKHYLTLSKDTAEEWTNPSFRIKLGSNEFVYAKTRVVNNRTIVPAREFISKLHPKNFGLSKLGNNISWMSGVTRYSTPVAEIDENGSSWVFLRDVCDKVGASFDMIKSV